MNSPIYNITTCDRRKYKRISVSYFSDISSDLHPFHVTVSNISEKGLCVNSPRCIDNEKILDLKVNCQVQFGSNVVKQFCIYLKAKMIWIYKDADDHFKCGCKILKSSEDLHNLKNHIQILYLQNFAENF
ncbi:MAG: PilZ domain-containing protein [Candidatus Aureabacteria bacterium]|nr:PilZ domain-containing protein [Candidatus Auribacterota bacterium]